MEVLVNEDEKAAELRELASALADWAAGASGATIYLFGSRVRGDHRPDSDVDVYVHWTSVNDELLFWWTENNEDKFAKVNAQLPGALQILERDDPLADKIREAGTRPKHQDRNVLCVSLPPKPSPS